MQYYDELLQIFIDKDLRQPAFQQANAIDNDVFASNKYALIKVPKDKLLREYTKHENIPDYNKVIAQYVSYPEPIEITSADFFKLMSKIEKVYDTKECKECSGEGAIECECCGHENDCDDCRGKGYIVDRTLPLVYDGDKKVKIHEAIFNPNLLEKLEKVIRGLNADTFLLTHGQHTSKPYVFQVKEAQVVLMPLMEDKADYTLNINSLATA